MFCDLALPVVVAEKSEESGESAHDEEPPGLGRQPEKAHASDCHSYGDPDDEAEGQEVVSRVGEQIWNGSQQRPEGAGDQEDLAERREAHDVAFIAVIVIGSILELALAPSPPVITTLLLAFATTVGGALLIARIWTLAKRGH